MTLDALSSVPLEECTTHDMLAILSLASTLGTGNWEEVAAAASKIRLPFFQRGSAADGYTSQECERIYSKAIQEFSGMSDAGSEKTVLDKAIGRLKDLRLNEIQTRLKSIGDILNHPNLEHPVHAVKDAQNTELDSTSLVGMNKSPPLTLEPNSDQGRVTDIVFSDNIYAKDQQSGPPSVPEAEMYMTPKDDYVEKPVAGIVAEDSKEKLAAGNSNILGSKERVLAKENSSDTKGSVVEKESMDSAHELGSAATYAINNNVQSKSDESKSNEIETSAESKHNVDRSDTEAAVDRQRETRKEQEPESMPEPDMEMGSSLGMAKENDSIDDNKANDNVKTEDTNTSQEHDLASKATAAPATPVVDEQQLKNWKKNINMVWRDLSGHRFGSMFINPIKSADAPNYYDVIRKPMDLKTIKNRVRDEEITTTVEFYRDIMHMLMNALMYNSEDTEVYQMAMEFIPDARACIEQLLQTEEAVKHPESSGGDVVDSNTPGVDVQIGSLKSEDDSRSVDHHDEEDSDASSVPTKRRRRIASERASKHLRI